MWRCHHHHPTRAVLFLSRPHVQAQGKKIIFQTNKLSDKWPRKIDTGTEETDSACLDFTD